MADKDVEPAINLLSRGFPERKPDYWRRALKRLGDRTVPKGRPRYGYVMADRGQLVGIVLVIFSTSDSGGTRGNVSSWYVEPAYRGFSNLLLAAPLKLKDVTLFNISPASTTVDTIQAQGFVKYAAGTFQALAALAPAVPGAQVNRIKAGDHEGLPLLVEHAAWDCLSFEVHHGGTAYPFVFVRSRFIGETLPCAHLIYCKDIGDFIRFAGPLGRRLLRHKIPMIMVDAEGPLKGLSGSYRPGRGLRYYCGSEPPRLGDLSYTELAIFGP